MYVAKVLQMKPIFFMRKIGFIKNNMCVIPSHLKLIVFYYCIFHCAEIGIKLRILIRVEQVNFYSFNKTNQTGK